MIFLASKSYFFSQEQIDLSPFPVSSWNLLVTMGGWYLPGQPHQGIPF